MAKRVTPLGLILLLFCQFAAANSASVPLFFAERSLSNADSQWLKNQAAEGPSQPVSKVELTNAFVFSAAQPLPLTPMSTLQQRRLIYATPLADQPAVQSGGVTIEQSGQVIRLPTLGFAEAISNLQASLLQYWLSKDLSPLRARVLTTQQQLGWSDWELLQLMNRYAASIFTQRHRHAFLAAFWHQLGYQVQLLNDQGQTFLFYRMQRPMVNKPMAQVQRSYWYSFDESWPEDIKFPQALTRTGQSIRFQSLNNRDEAAGVHYVAVDIEQQPPLVIRLPRHWLHIQRSPVLSVEQFRTPFNPAFFSALNPYLNGQTPADKQMAFANWLRDDFSFTEQPLSIYQAVLLKKLNSEMRLVLFAKGWQFLTQQPAALVTIDGQQHLALKLPALAFVENSLLYRKAQWWLWDAELVPVSGRVSVQHWQLLP